MILHSSITGSGPDIVLLHGLFGAGRNLGVIARGLAARYRVTSLDARNHGASPHASDMSYESMAADVAETMDALGIREAIMVGHSMGGKTAMTLALTHPSLIGQLAVLDIAPIAYDHEHLGYIRSMCSISLHPGLTRQAADEELAGTIAEPALRGFLLHNLVLGDNPHWRLGLAEIAAAMDDLVSWHDPLPGTQWPGPALFVVGENSTYVPKSSHQAIDTRFPAARIVTIAGAGHWLHAEKPQAVLAALWDFLEG